MLLPTQAASLDIAVEKYCKNGETTLQQIRARVAKALASVEKDSTSAEALFLSAQERGVVMAGRINSAAGTSLESTLINCFVQPVGDCMSGADENNYPGICDALTQAALTMRRGGGVGYDFSRLRPKGAHVVSIDAEASGPVSYMHMFDAMCGTVISAGTRRGAQMGILRVDHPDIEEFIKGKDVAGRLVNFNISVAITDQFMQALKADALFDLVHSKSPGRRLIEEARTAGHPIVKNEQGLWIYRRIKARELWNMIMLSTYDHAEPGVVFIDRINSQNNLYYCETIEACNPCAEQPLPAYGCCCLGSIDLTKLVKDPFHRNARFDQKALSELTAIAVRMLDNVLDVTYWPLPEQKREASNKRRIGLGFLGLGNTLTMLGIPYNSVEARAFAASVAKAMRDAAYLASVGLAQEKGAFPLFQIREYLDGAFAKTLPESLRSEIAKYGLRNSHLLSIAPTGTITLAFADNASNGIEPAFEWSYTRRKRNADSTWSSITVEDHAYRVFRSINGAEAPLPKGFVSALQISAADHSAMVETVQPYIDASISKTVNVPADYPIEKFMDLYMNAYAGGVKGLATFRPNDVTGSILVSSDQARQTGKTEIKGVDDQDPDRRIVLKELPTPTLNSMRWPKRPSFPNGNDAKCYRVKHPHGAKFALFVGEVQNGSAYPFEVWVTGQEAPRGLNALAKVLSFDMYTFDRGWLKRKLDSLAACSVNGEAFQLAMPPNGEVRYVPSLVSAMAQLILHRCNELRAFDNVESTPVLDALMCKKEPKTTPDGTMSWTVDVRNHGTEDDFVLGLKELEITTPQGTQRRPYSMWLSGVYPRSLDGLCKALSLDMQVIDPAWVSKKLRELRDYEEPHGSFFATVPGTTRQEHYRSTVAYIAQLILHRYRMLGILDDEGYPVEALGIVEIPQLRSQPIDVMGKARSVGAMAVRPELLCSNCGGYTMIKTDGCKRCTSCGHDGGCG